MKKDVLGVKIDDVSLNEAVETVIDWLEKPGQHFIVTPNPEFLVKSQEDPKFKQILNQADLAIPDGVGLKLAGIKNRVTGVDLMEKLIRVCNEKGYTIGLLGGRNGVAEKLAERLRQRYQNLSISFVSEGGEVNTGGQLLGVLPARDPAVHPRSTSLAAATRRDALLAVTPRISRAELLFVAFGHPKQEKWIVQNLNKIPVKVAMGVGGAFDYLSGLTPRAPNLIKNLGLEWLFRLILQPWRIKRQIKLLKYLKLLILGV